MKFGKDKNKDKPSLDEINDKNLDDARKLDDESAKADAKAAEDKAKAKQDEAVERFDKSLEDQKQKAQDKVETGNDKTLADPKSSYVIKSVGDDELKTEQTTPDLSDAAYVDPDAHALSLAANRTDLKAVPAAPTTALREIPTGLQAVSKADRDRKIAASKNLDGVHKKIEEARDDGRQSVTLDYGLSHRELETLRSEGYEASVDPQGGHGDKTAISWSRDTSKN